MKGGLGTAGELFKNQMERSEMKKHWTQFGRYIENKVGENIWGNKTVLVIIEAV